MNRAEMIARVRAEANPAYREELAHYMGIEEREYAYDEVCAALDIEDRIAQALRDDMPAEHRAGYRRTLANARRVLIDIGFYKPVAELHAELGELIQSTGPRYAFKLDGVEYDTAETSEEWFDRAGAD